MCVCMYDCVCKTYMGTQHMWQMITNLDDHESSVNLIYIVTEDIEFGMDWL